MRPDKRIEKRAATKVPIHLLPMENALIRESTMTVNISRSGARILTDRRWRPGEFLDLASSTGEFHRQCRVIYCHPLTDRQFCVGLEFDASLRSRKDARWASVA
jgi:hypothetical protein